MSFLKRAFGEFAGIDAGTLYGITKAEQLNAETISRDGSLVAAYKQDGTAVYESHNSFTSAFAAIPDYTENDPDAGPGPFTSSGGGMVLIGGPVEVSDSDVPLQIPQGVTITGISGADSRVTWTKDDYLFDYSGGGLEIQLRNFEAAGAGRTGNSQSVVKVDEAPKPTVIDSLEIHDVGGDAIQMNAAGPAKIQNCQIADYGGYGIAIDNVAGDDSGFNEDPDLEVENNLISMNDDSTGGVILDNWRAVTFRNNLIENAGTVANTGGVVFNNGVRRPISLESNSIEMGAGGPALYSPGGTVNRAGPITSTAGVYSSTGGSAVDLDGVAEVTFMGDQFNGDVHIRSNALYVQSKNSEGNSFVDNLVTATGELNPRTGRLAHRAPRDLSGETGAFVGQVAYDDGTNASAGPMMCQWTGSAWQPADGGATF